MYAAITFNALFSGVLSELCAANVFFLKHNFIKQTTNKRTQLNVFAKGNNMSVYVR